MQHMADAMRIAAQASAIGATPGRPEIAPAALLEPLQRMLAFDGV